MADFCSSGHVEKDMILSSKVIIYQKIAHLILHGTNALRPWYKCITPNTTQNSAVTVFLDESDAPLSF